MVMILVNLLRILGIAQLILGLLFWTGRAYNLLQVHMTIGVALVITLVTLALLAARAGVSPGMVILAILWAALVPLLGFNQARILPGDLHIVVQVAHLLVGLVAIGLGEGLADRIGRVEGDKGIVG